jgi:hypothetical protein
MMDDNQEQQMSVNKLVFDNDVGDTKITIEFKDNELTFSEKEMFFAMNRSEAHFLMLYLQQHLGYVSISKDRLNEND